MYIQILSYILQELQRYSTVTVIYMYSHVESFPCTCKYNKLLLSRSFIVETISFTVRTHYSILKKLFKQEIQHLDPPRECCVSTSSKLLWNRRRWFCHFLLLAQTTRSTATSTPLTSPTCSGRCTCRGQRSLRRWRQLQPERDMRTLRYRYQCFLCFVYTLMMYFTNELHPQSLKKKQKAKNNKKKEQGRHFSVYCIN